MGSDVCRKPTPFSKPFCQGCVDLPHQQDQSQVHQSAGDIGDIPSLEDKMCMWRGFRVQELLQVRRRLMKCCITVSHLIFYFNADRWGAHLSTQNRTPSFKHHYAHYTAVYDHCDQEDHHYTQLGKQIKRKRNRFG